MLLDFKCPGTELSEFSSYGYTLRRGNLQSFRGRKEGRQGLRAWTGNHCSVFTSHQLLRWLHAPVIH